MCTVLPFSLSFCTIITVRWRSSVERVKFIQAHSEQLWVCACVSLFYRATNTRARMTKFDFFLLAFVVFGEFFTMFSLKGGNFYRIRWILHFPFASRDFCHKLLHFSSLKTQVFTFYASIFTPRSLVNRKSMTSGCSRVIASRLNERIN